MLRMDLQFFAHKKGVGSTKNGRGKKIIVYKYKRKSGYHKKNGHRQAYTKVKIDAINA